MVLSNGVVVTDGPRFQHSGKVQSLASWERGSKPCAVGCPRQASAIYFELRVTRRVLSNVVKSLTSTCCYAFWINWQTSQR